MERKWNYHVSTSPQEEGLLQTCARFGGHMQQLVLQPLVDKLMQALAEDIALP